MLRPDQLARVLARRCAAEAELARYFRRSGRIRSPSEARKRTDGPRYRKGWEVRFIAHDDDEAARIRELLVAIGLRPGAPYKKAGEAVVQPVYGARSVAIVRQLIDLYGDAGPG